MNICVQILELSYCVPKEHIHTVNQKKSGVGGVVEPVKGLLTAVKKIYV